MLRIYFLLCAVAHSCLPSSHAVRRTCRSHFCHHLVPQGLKHPSAVLAASPFPVTYPSRRPTCLIFKHQKAGNIARQHRAGQAC